MTKSSHSSTSVLHKQWVKLEDEHHELAIAIEKAQLGHADLAPMRERQARLLLEINSLVAKIRDAPATTIEDFLALLDVALEHELDLASDIAFFGPADYPMTTRLFRILAAKLPGFELNSLKRWMSSNEQLDHLMGDTAERAEGSVEPTGFGDPEICLADRWR